jgi:hypothetical protein
MNRRHLFSSCLGLVGNINDIDYRYYQIPRDGISEELKNKLEKLEKDHQKVIDE